MITPYDNEEIKMKPLQKKLVSVGAVCALMIVGAVTVRKTTYVSVQEDEPVIEMVNLAEEGAYQRAATDLTFWYEDVTYTDFFEKAALDYFKETGVKVTVQCKNTIDYMGDIYDETMQDGVFPDVYLISGNNLEEAYLYGLVSVNEKGLGEIRVAENAVNASTYGEELLGYPLSYNTCVFVYQNDYFSTAPESLQAIIDYSNQNEPGENVEYLLEWDVNDAFYDFPFVSNSVTFDKSEPEVMNVIYDEELYQKDLEYFEGILASFSVDAEKVSESRIVENFKAKRTLSAIIDTNSLYKLSDYNYSLMLMPDLNDELPAYTCAITDMLVVNDFSEEAELASDFAYYVTVTMSDELHAMSGHYSVVPSNSPDWVEQVAYQAYEASVLAPNSQDARDFWVKLEETISQYF